MKISAIVCAYNEAAFLPACLHSLFSQTRPPDEVIVVNNASTDETGAVARARYPASASLTNRPRGWSSPARRGAGRRRATCSPMSMPTAGRRCSGWSASSALRASPGGRGRDRSVQVLRLGFARPGAPSRLRRASSRRRRTSSSITSSAPAPFSTAATSRFDATRSIASAGSIGRSSSTARTRISAAG